MVEEQVDLITKATMAAHDLQEKIAKYEELDRKMAAFEARMILAGRSNANNPAQREPTEAEKLRDETKAAFKGTVLDGVLK